VSRRFGEPRTHGSCCGVTSEQVLLWGGNRGGNFTYWDVSMEGLSFDPSSGRWERIPEPESLPPLTPSVSAWTGTELIVLGSKSRGQGVVGASYQPRDRSWKIINFPYRGWSGFEGVWTGAELVLWGGPDHFERPRRRGAVYDPGTDSWRKTAPAPIGGRWSHSVVWTGTEMIVWGGSNANTDLADGAAYDPATDSWRTIAPSPLSPRQWLSLVWTGKEVIVWGGSSYSRSRGDGAAYNPVTDSWRRLPPAPIRPRHYHTATWTGSEVLVFGGYDYNRSFRDGAAYDPASDSWRRIPRAPIASRCCHSAVWTGTSLFVFGGSQVLGRMALGDGAHYDPASDRWRRVIPTTSEPKTRGARCSEDAVPHQRTAFPPWPTRATIVRRLG
jgi:N-acetylneuraminic acid mutarotase